MKKSISVALKFTAVLFLVIALLFMWAFINALLDRVNYGAGLMFADVEIFLFLTLFFLILSIVLFWIVKRTNKTK